MSHITTENDLYIYSWMGIMQSFIFSCVVSKHKLNIVRQATHCKWVSQNNLISEISAVDGCLCVNRIPMDNRLYLKRERELIIKEEFACVFTRQFLTRPDGSRDFICVCLCVTVPSSGNFKHNIKIHVMWLGWDYHFSSRCRIKKQMLMLCGKQWVC
jgi:hypothetical protein